MRHVRGSTALLALAASGLLLAGCVPEVAVRAVPAGSAAPSAPAPAPAADEFKAALRKTHNATYKYKVSSELPDNQRVAGTGAFDRRTKKLQTSLKYTGGTFPHALQSVVIGNDLWTKEPGDRRWVHLNMARLKKFKTMKVDMADPVGLGAFTGAIKQVRKTGPRTYAGTFDPSPAGADEFLPLGAPSIVVFSFGGTPGVFSATTDADGWVTVINAKITADETVKMTTRFTGHGQASGIKKPSRTGEADDFYYE